ncbi:MAG TPA: hypothetical protein ENL19_02815 [candidate division WOR-3 bacterium]|uniref:Uncharacterized protein n=1 Tax=candidate division WOR-3 bacterium TaxID=2052148 RepID=A0A7C5HNV4_UNCW3|nr:hypothetical protein [candidate division WOR-3 bacterium]
MSDQDKEAYFRIGLTILLVIIGLFVMMYSGLLAYKEYNEITRQSIPSLTSIEDLVSEVTPIILYYGLRLAFLSVMVWIGSILLYRGIQLMMKFGGKV